MKKHSLIALSIILVISTLVAGTFLLFGKQGLIILGLLALVLFTIGLYQARHFVAKNGEL